MDAMGMVGVDDPMIFSRNASFFWGDELRRGKTGATKGSEASLDQKHG